MKLKLEMNDAVLEAGSFEEMVTKLRLESFDGKDLSDSGFMKRMSLTAYDCKKAPVRTDTAENFLLDLAAGRMLTLVMEKE